MALGNTPAGYGLFTRLLHWVMAFMVIGAIAAGTWLANSEPSLAKIPYYATHKSVGMTILALLVVRFVWHRISPTPAVKEHGWQTTAANFVHRGFYVLLLAMPLSGWAASSSTGIDTVIFDAFTLPRIAPVSERWAEVGFQVHDVIGKLLVAFIILHVGGALVRRDGTLSRMTRGSSNERASS